MLTSNTIEELLTIEHANMLEMVGLLTFLGNIVKTDKLLEKCLLNFTTFHMNKYEFFVRFGKINYSAKIYEAKGVNCGLFTDKKIDT